MNKFSIILLFVSVLSFTSCSSVKSLTGSTATAETITGTTAGTSCGKVLGSLYTQYKSTGKVDVSNAATLISIKELGTSFTSLKSNMKNTSYLGAFAKGLVTGSNGLVSSSNSLSTVSSLMSLSSLNNITSTTTASSASVTNVASGLTTLFNNLKK